MAAPAHTANNRHTDNYWLEDIAAILAAGGSSPSSIGNGNKSVTTAGTAVALASTTACKSVTIMARLSNTGYIAVGGSGVDATLTTGDGVLLGAGDTLSLDIADLSTIFIDATVSGEGVRFTYTV